MDVSLPSLLLGIAGFSLASVLASKASSRFGVPALLLFLVVRMLAGSDGPGGITFDYPRLVVLIDRHGVSIVPSGGTVVQEGDKPLVLTGPKEISAVRSLFTA
jgi:NhaP-type Na+/H+ and K+/H+ antiporter